MIYEQNVNSGTEKIVLTVHAKVWYTLGGTDRNCCRMEEKMAVTYKCPNCGADLRFDEQTQEMVCEHCGTQIAVSDLQEEEPEREEGFRVEVEDAEGEDDSGQGDFRAFHCPSCGAQLMTDDTTAATFCMFCGNPALIEERLSKEKRPAYVLPFQKSRKDAEEVFRNWARRGLLTPKHFSAKSTVEKISGIYVPFWLYDYAADADVQAHATRVCTSRRGDTEYIHTDHFRLTRDVSNRYEKIPADASANMPDDVMDRLEPFDYGKMVPFEMPYLAGFLAEKYSYDGQQIKKRAEKRAEQYILEDARETMTGYATVSVTSEQVRLRCEQMKYVLLPVWMLNYRYKGKQYLFAMNGQSGRYVADRPLSVGKAVGWWCGITAGLSAVLLALAVLF